MDIIAKLEKTSDTEFKEDDQKSLFSKNVEDYAFYPILNENLLHYRDMQIEVFWVATEVQFDKDNDDWKTLNESEQHFLQQIFGFFAQFDGLVGENIKKISDDTSFIKECDSFYAIQAAIESVHNEVYSIIIDTVIIDLNKRNELLDSIRNNKVIGKLAIWVQTWMNAGNENYNYLLERIIIFAILEGVWFSGMFAGIYWLKHKYNGKFGGITTANEFISRDENIHCCFAIELYKTLIEKYNYTRLDEELVHNICKNAIDTIGEFYRYALSKGELNGFTYELAMDYVKSIMDVVLDNIGYSAIYNIEKIPFEFMEQIGLHNKSNFFEKNVTDYRRVLNKGKKNHVLDATTLLENDNY